MPASCPPRLTLPSPAPPLPSLLPSPLSPSCAPFIFWYTPEGSALARSPSPYRINICSLSAFPFTDLLTCLRWAGRPAGDRVPSNVWQVTRGPPAHPPSVAHFGTTPPNRWFSQPGLVVPRRCHLWQPRLGAWRKEVPLGPGWAVRKLRRPTPGARELGRAVPPPLF